MVRAAALIGLLMLTGCDRSVYSGWAREKTAERADIADVNARNSLAKLSDLEDRIGELEDKVRELEDRANTAQNENVKDSANIASLSRDTLEDQKSIEKLYENDKRIAARIGMPVGEN